MYSSSEMYPSLRNVPSLRYVPLFRNLPLSEKCFLFLQTSTYVGIGVAIIGTLYFLGQCVTRFRNQELQLYQL